MIEVWYTEFYKEGTRVREFLDKEPTEQQLQDGKFTTNGKTHYLPLKGMNFEVLWHGYLDENLWKAVSSWD